MASTGESNSGGKSVEEILQAKHANTPKEVQKTLVLGYTRKDGKSSDDSMGNYKGQ